MKNKNKPLNESIFGNVCNVIRKTWNYDLFKTLKSNRDINLRDVEKWIIRIKKRDLDIPFIVDKDYNLLEGQHRFEARKSLGLPIFYFISEKIDENDLSEIQKGKPWDVNAYLKNAVKLGIEPYVKYNDLFKEYNDKKVYRKNNISHNELRMIVMGMNAPGSKITEIFNDKKMTFVRPRTEVRSILDWMFKELPHLLSTDVLRDRYFQRALMNLYSYENFDKKIFETMIIKPKYRNYFESRDFIKGEDADSKVNILMTAYNVVAKTKNKSLTH